MFLLPPEAASSHAQIGAATIKGGWKEREREKGDATQIRGKDFEQMKDYCVCVCVCVLSGNGTSLPREKEKFDLQMLFPLLLGGFFSNFLSA